MSNPYLNFAAGFDRLLKKGKTIRMEDASAASQPLLSEKALKVLLFSPHPDDECITGALPLRLLRELKMNVINVAVTLGSRKDRQLERLKELKRACNFIGFGLVTLGDRGLEKVNLKGRKEDPGNWAKGVDAAANLIRETQPSIIFVPHEGDWNSTHIGTCHLVNEAMGRLEPSFHCRVVETEFWAAMSNPNLMIESSVADVGDIVAAISLHAGEVERNPYHLRLPAWMQDNVRRGGELVGGQGGAAPDYAFSTLYRVSNFTQNKRTPLFEGGRCVSCNESLSAIFG